MKCLALFWCSLVANLINRSLCLVEHASALLYLSYVRTRLLDLDAWGMSILSKGQCYGKVLLLRG